MFLSAPAQAADTTPGQQLAGLFVQSCLSFAGDTVGLRNWGRQLHLAELPDPARSAFLHGATGVVFDASNTSGKFVVVSTDQGGCWVMTNAANGEAVIAGLEADLAHAGVQFRFSSERDDNEQAALHYRQYTASRNGRTWRIVAATVKDQKAGQAMLSADPE